MPPKSEQGKEVGPVAGRVVTREFIEMAELPEILRGKLVLADWAESMMTGKAYKEADPNYLSRLLAWQTMTAATIEQMLTQSSVRKLQEMVPNTPGASSGNIEITNIYVAESDQTEGNPCYVILDVVDMDNGTTYKLSTGATQIQAFLIGSLRLGHWPIRCKFIRLDRKDRGGRFLFAVVQPD